MKGINQSRRGVVAVLASFAAAGLLTTATPAFSQSTSWPQQAIRIVVPFAPGGNTDIVGRVLAEQLSKDLGVAVVIDNRAGATGIIGTNYVVDQPADGYTFLLSTISITISPHIHKSMPADIVSRLSPVSQVTTVPKVLVVHPSLPVTSVAELVEYSKSQDKPVTYGSSGVGSAHHLSGELFRLHYGLNMTHVPYKGGAPAANDLMGGQIEMVFDDIPPAHPYIQAGRMKALAVSSDMRSPLLSDVPTISEEGAEGAMVEPWYGVLAPGGTPEEIVKSMDAAIGKVVESDQFQKRILEMGGVPAYKSTKEFSEFIQRENERWGEVVRKAGIQPQ